jgi:arylsulfatase A
MTLRVPTFKTAPRLRLPSMKSIPAIFLCLSAVLLPSLPAHAAEAARQPNIIFILADDMGYNDLGCYGAKLISTPRLDRMAAEGMRFTRHYAGSSVCAPSRSTFITGQHTGHTPIRGNLPWEPSGEIPLPAGTITISSLLKQAGYTNAMIGKWGLGIETTPGNPRKHGFHHYFGYLDQVLAHNHTPEFLMRNDEKIPLANKVQYVPKDHWSRGLGSFPLAMKEFSQELFTREALKFVEDHRDQPFFLYYPVVIPHDNGEALLGKRYSEIPSFGSYANKPWTEEEKGYAAMITWLDAELGKLFDKLTALGLDENTLVIFTSDNGGDSPGRFHKLSNQPLRGHKRDLYEGGLRVPMIARWKGTVPAGKLSDHVSANWDFLPTFCEIAGVPAPATTDGISMAPTLLEKSSQAKHDFLYWEFHEQSKKQAVLKGPWKAVRLNVARNPRGPVELYNLDADPAETRDVSAQYPETTAELTRLMDSTRKDDPNWEFRDRGPAGK